MFHLLIKNLKPMLFFRINQRNIDKSVQQSISQFKTTNMLTSNTGQLNAFILSLQLKKLSEYTYTIPIYSNQQPVFLSLHEGASYELIECLVVETSPQNCIYAQKN